MTIGCDEAKRWVDAWIDQELDPSAALLIEAHMARCCACRAEADALGCVKRSLAGLREECAPTALRHRVLAALDEEDDSAEVAHAAAQRKKHAVGFALTGAALAGVVLAGGMRSRGDASTSQAGLLPVIEDVARRHAHELPAEVSGSDPAEVSRWFRGKLDIPVRPVTFQGAPARLVGGRISNVRDRMAAALYYDVGGRRMTVFMFDGALVPHEAVLQGSVDGRPYYITSSHGYTVTLTEVQGVGCAIASDLPPQEAARVVALLP